MVVIEPVPVAPLDQDPFACLTTGEALEACRFVANTESLPIEHLYRPLADNRTVYDMDADRMLCPFMPICDPIVGGEIVRFDIQHITPRFGITIADEVATYLRDSGVLSF